MRADFSRACVERSRSCARIWRDNKSLETRAAPGLQGETSMPIDSRTFRQTVGQFVTGVTVIALDVDGTLRAMTANSFTSLSLDPPLVLFCVGKHTRAG